MIKKSFFIVLLLMFAFSAQAVDLQEIKNQPDGLIYNSTIPLTTERFVAYGRIVPTPKGKKSPDLSEAAKVVQKARDARDKLLLIRDPRGFFALQVVMIQHSSMTLVKEPLISWDTLRPEIEVILSELEK